MAKGGKEESKKKHKGVMIGAVYMLTLLLWAMWLLFQICVDKRARLLTIVSAFVFFQFANLLIRLSVSRDPIFVNTAVSLIHSALSSSFVLIIVVSQWSADLSLQLFEHDQLVRNTWPWAYTALCFSSGYFAYDQWDMLYYRLYTGPFPSILAHHFILLLCFSLALYRNVTINYLILTLICERSKCLPAKFDCISFSVSMNNADVDFLLYETWSIDVQIPAVCVTEVSASSLLGGLHSVFLHVRKLRRMAGIRKAESGIVKVEWVLNWFTFFSARLIPHALILIKLVKDASKFDKGIELPLALFGMIGMNALNIGLGIDLLGAYKREISRPHDHRSD
ncbi:hypothetical protein KSS87_019079 [Heliosperma pusillum]|nr:hypothetical protein KSS87_019079 [Heliosperma pusillum]